MPDAWKYSHVWEGGLPQCQSVKAFCRSELAREKLAGAAFIQEARVIVGVFREQARSYRGQCHIWTVLSAACGARYSGAKVQAISQ
jgi:hypothetical protein